MLCLIEFVCTTVAMRFWLQATCAAKFVEAVACSVMACYTSLCGKSQHHVSLVSVHVSFIGNGMHHLNNGMS